jgi:hypothetical protein
MNAVLLVLLSSIVPSNLAPATEPSPATVLPPTTGKAARAEQAPATWSGDEETVSRCTSQGKITREPSTVFSLHDSRGGYLSYIFVVFAVEHYPDGGALAFLVFPPRIFWRDNAVQDQCKILPSCTSAHLVPSCS